MKIGIIGAGAMGCLYAAMLCEKHEVTLFDVNRTVVDALNRDGIRMQSPAGDEKVYRIPAVMSGEGKKAFDLVILFVKDTASEAALTSNRMLIGEQTLLLTLQNGMGNDTIMERFVPKDRILLGTTKHNCVTLSPGVIYHSGAGVTHIGSLSGNHEAAGWAAKSFRDCGIETEACEDVRRLLWQKLFVNMTVNPITAILDSEISVIRDDPYAHALSRTLIDEAVAVAAADGEKFASEDVFCDVMKTVDGFSRGRSSMWQDISHGRKTEIDFINGAVVKLGEKYHIPTPCHAAIVQLVHAKESLVKQ